MPDKIDAVLRKRAKNTGKSLNEVTIEALAKGSGVAIDSMFDDLDWFLGKRSLDSASFDTAEKWLGKLPKDIQ